jgi:hypothetical protein
LYPRNLLAFVDAAYDNGGGSAGTASAEVLPGKWMTGKCFWNGRCRMIDSRMMVGIALDIRVPVEL